MVKGTIGRKSFSNPRKFIQLLNRAIRLGAPFDININFSGVLRTSSGLLISFTNGKTLKKEINSLGRIQFKAFVAKKIVKVEPILDTEVCVSTITPQGVETAKMLKFPVFISDEILKFKTIYCIGMFKQQLPSVEKALKEKKDVIIHWVGSDVLQTEGGLKKARHFVVHERLQEELGEKGVEVEGIFPHYSMCKNYPFKGEVNPNMGGGGIDALTYLPNEFYGISRIRELANQRPETTFHVIGNRDPISLPRNCIKYGWVGRKQIDNLMGKCQIYMRFTEHDGLPMLLIEAMQRGLVCYTSYPYPGCFSEGSQPSGDGKSWSEYYKSLADPIVNKVKIDSILGLTPCVKLEKELGLKRPNIGKIENPPLVSILITSYNYGQYIDETIRSCIEQSYENIEIVIVDDASTDNTVEKLKKYGDKIRIYHHEKNLGCASTINDTLDRSEGVFISHLSADDICFPSWKIEEQVLKILKSEADLVHGDYAMFGDRSGVQKLGPTNDLDGDNSIGTPSVMYGRSKVRIDVSLKTMEDFSIWKGLMDAGYKFEYFPIVWGAYRNHSKQKHKLIR